MKLISLRGLACVISCGLVLSATGVRASTILVPVADTYVASGAATTVEGATTSMVANQSTNANHRWAYVRFDLSSINTSSITNLELDLHNTGAGGAATFVNVYGLTSNENFSETGLTFSNDPNASGNFFNSAGTFNSSPLTSFTSSGKAGTDVAFIATSGPVFDFINVDADKIVTFVLDQQTATGIVGQAWSTREDVTANRPSLIVTTAATPEPVTFGFVAFGSLGLLARRRRA